MATSDYIRLKLQNGIRKEPLRNLAGRGDRVQQGWLREWIQGPRPEAPTLRLFLGCRCPGIRYKRGQGDLIFSAVDLAKKPAALPGLSLHTL